MKICYAATGIGFSNTFAPSIHVLSLCREMAKMSELSVLFNHLIDPLVDTDFLVFNLNIANFESHARTRLADRVAFASRFLEYLAKINQFVQEHGEFDVIVERMWTWGGALASSYKNANIPCLLEVNETWDWNWKAVNPLMPVRFAKFLLAKRRFDTVDRVVVQTEQMRHFLDDVFDLPREKIRIVPNGVNLELFRPLSLERCREELGISRDPTVLVYVGTLDRIKDLKPCMRALKSVGRNIELHIVGSGPYQEHYKRFKDELDLPNCIFYGAIAHAEVPKYIGAADFCIAPYDIREFERGVFTYFPLKILEYMACGRLTITQPFGAISGIIRDYDNGFLIKNDVSSWLKCLGRLPDRRTVKREVCRLRAESEQYSWDSVAHQYLGICREVVD